MVSDDPSAQRERMRTWLTELLAAEGVAIALDDPVEWAGWDPATRRWAP